MIRRLIRMGIGRGGGGAATPAWWNAGGLISAANCVLAYTPIGAASAAASYVNLANPGTHDLTVGVAPTFNADLGWLCNGSTTYLNTGYVPNNSNGLTAIVQFSGGLVEAASHWVWGARTTIYFGTRNSYTDSQASWSNGSTLYHSVGLVAGVMAIAGTGAYLDGAYIGEIPGSTYNFTSTIYLGRCNGVTQQAFGGYISAFALYNTVLDAPTIATLTAALP